MSSALLRGVAAAAAGAPQTCRGRLAVPAVPTVGPRCASAAASVAQPARRPAPRRQRHRRGSGSVELFSLSLSVAGSSASSSDGGRGGWPSAGAGVGTGRSSAAGAWSAAGGGSVGDADADAADDGLRGPLGLPQALRTHPADGIEASAGPGPSGDEDTIAAVVTASVGGAVAIVRLSGPKAVEIAGRVFRPARRRGTPPPPAGQLQPPWRPESHRAEYGRAVEETTGIVLDEVLALPMLAPRSYTREDVVELHCHGGPVNGPRVLNAVLAAGARGARPGEFTLRAFLNGRLDLSQAEAVGALVAARTPRAADAALAGLAGGLARAVGAARAECIDLLTEMEARLDFDDEMAPLDMAALRSRLAALRGAVEGALATSRRGQLLTAGLSAAIVGRPNAGKSSLLNALAGSDRAIVTDVPGTTRDVLEAAVSFAGVPVRLLDTAGLRDTSDVVEALGVARARAAARAADVVVVVVDASAGWTEEDSAIAAEVLSSGSGAGDEGRTGGLAGPSRAWSAALSPPGAAADPAGAPADGGLTFSSSSFSVCPSGGPPAVLVMSKVDRLPPDSPLLRLLLTAAAAVAAPLPAGGSAGGGSGAPSSEEAAAAASAAAAAVPGLPAPLRTAFRAVVPTSASTGTGLESLQAAVLEAVGVAAGGAGAGPDGAAWALNGRQAEAMLRAAEALQRVEETVAADLPLDFWTIDLKGAAAALGEVAGEAVAEEVLDGVFARFCIGK